MRTEPIVILLAIEFAVFVASLLVIFVLPLFPSIYLTLLTVNILVKPRGIHTCFTVMTLSTSCKTTMPWLRSWLRICQPTWRQCGSSPKVYIEEKNKHGKWRNQMCIYIFILFYLNDRRRTGRVWPSDSPTGKSLQPCPGSARTA